MEIGISILLDLLSLVAVVITVAKPTFGYLSNWWRRRHVTATFVKFLKDPKILAPLWNWQRSRNRQVTVTFRAEPTGGNSGVPRHTTHTTAA